MSFSVTCEKCLKVLKVPDSAVGKKGRCPQCGTVMELNAPASAAAIPAAVFAPPDNEVYDAEQVADSGAAPATDGERKPCPACGEMIVKGAMKCRFCGEIFDKTLKSTANDAELADPGTRLVAVILDGLVAVAAALPGVIVIFATLSGGSHNDPPLAGILLAVFGVVALAIYQMVLLSTKGQTLGKGWMKVRVVKYTDGSPAGFFGAVFMRSWVPGFIGNIPIVGFIFAIADPLFIFGAEHRCLHDQIAGTKVIKV